jgi:hypothetical protein
MDNQQQDTTRAAAYLAAKERLDLRGAKSTRTGKTRNTINCTAGNKRCGNRCIPNNWDCRLEGKGTNSDLSAHSQDLLAGTAKLQRGSRDLIKGLSTANPELINRGRNSLVLGAVKIAPGDKLDKKKQLKQDILRNTRPVVTVLTLGVLGLAAHRGLKKTWPGYANGMGRKLDDAVKHGYNSVLDRTPIVGARRAAIRATGFGAVQQGSRQLLKGNELARKTSAMANSNPLKPGLAATVGISADTRGSSLINKYDEMVRGAKGSVNRDTWIQKGRQLVYDAKDKKGNSVYSTDASAYLLTKQFGLDPRGMIGDRVRSSYTTTARREILQIRLGNHFNELSTAMRRDMEVRGMDVKQYTESVLKPQIATSTMWIPVAGDRKAASQQSEQFLTRLITKNTISDHKDHANEIIKKTETHFNTVFNDLSLNLNRNAASSESPADEATLGFARFLSTNSRGPAVRVVNNEHADLYLEGVFRRRVNGQNDPIVISRPTAVRVAKAVAGHATNPTPEQALQILKVQGGINATYAASTGRVRVQQSLTERARQLMATGNLSYEAALRQARKEATARGDSDDSGIPPRVEAYLEARTDLKENPRLGKTCGESHIPKSHKCTKGIGASTQSAVSKHQAAKIAAISGGVLLAGALLTGLGVNQAKVNRYRSNVSESAIKAEVLAKTMMDEMRQSAAQRLGKDVKDVTGFEASVYNFKDSGHDRGFGSNDKAPAYFGQTPNSRGGVVMLSYADDNRFTRQGQGSYKMAKGGAFQEIWGEHDVLPFANSISQPSRRSPDDMTMQARERVVKAAGPLGGAVKGAVNTKEAFSNFDYLSENINRRGHNPDAIRAAAFVVAQRRLTGKPINLMSYSNGGNVASETLAILKDMGYRDVKVINIAGPTFGVFSHSRDQMRTWVSRGDEFWSMGRSAAFQGSNIQFLRNSNIPHGLTAKTDPNNRENGANWKANFKAKNSYLLDEQLQREAHQFLTVDNRRSRELADEFIWRSAERKPFEGDLDTLLGARATSVAATYRQKRKANLEAADNWLRDELEKSMIDKWYGGYNAKTVKNRQKEIQRDLQEQIHGKKSAA